MEKRKEQSHLPPELFRDLELPVKLPVELMMAVPVRPAVEVPVKLPVTGPADVPVEPESDEAAVDPRGEEVVSRDVPGEDSVAEDVVDEGGVTVPVPVPVVAKFVLYVNCVVIAVLPSSPPVAWKMYVPEGTFWILAMNSVPA